MPNSNAIRTRSRAATPARELSWSFMLLVILCACIVAAGFFFAARQHFNAMDYSMKNSKLREQIQSLETEKRRLKLAREVALSPTSLRKAARGLGLSDSTAPTTVVASVKPSQDKIEAVKASDTKNVPAKTPATIIKTVMTEPQQQTASGETRGRVVDARKEKTTTVAALLKLR